LLLFEQKGSLTIQRGTSVQALIVWLVVVQKIKTASKAMPHVMLFKDFPTVCEGTVLENNINIISQLNLHIDTESAK
jgi:hypothetical protein